MAEVDRKTCEHFLKRKKRLCKMEAARGKRFCCEHEPIVVSIDEGSVERSERIPCPLDPKHTINRKHLQKHLKICNSRAPSTQPPYITKDINTGEIEEADVSALTTEIKLHDLSNDEFYGVIDKIKSIYGKYYVQEIPSLELRHSVLDEELAKCANGKDSRKHLLQTSALLGVLDNGGVLDSDTTFVEFGAGKGQLAFWLANALQQASCTNSQVVLLDRMSLRHKKDNKLEDKSLVKRLRADIADFCLTGLAELEASKRLVAISKHLCGAATDLTLRCCGQQTQRHADTILIALCCHHRCDYKAYVGKHFLRSEAVTVREFVIITKMVGWAICGSGMSRERRRALEAQASSAENVQSNADDVKTRLTQSEREEIGRMCKRILDYGRLDYLRQQGYEADLKQYVARDVTLENICLLAKKQI